MQGLSVVDITFFAVASIMGVEFHAGQWGRRTCSSVITCVINGRSVYGRVTKFFAVGGERSCPGYASVLWFGPPTYPRGSNRLEVVVGASGRDLVSEIGLIVRITQIDPSPVVVEPDANRMVYRMMRQSGTDTVV